MLSEDCLAYLGLEVFSRALPNLLIIATDCIFSFISNMELHNSFRLRYLNIMWSLPYVKRAKKTGDQIHKGPIVPSRNYTRREFNKILVSFGLCPVCRFHKYLIAHDFKNKDKKIWICEECMIKLMAE
jgi:hypothetical protein